MVLPLVIRHSSTLWIATAVCAWAMSVLGQFFASAQRSRTGM